jgi:ppGpp synthetase/RelA/SpoT-type nucleotidyltranferase
VGPESPVLADVLVRLLDDHVQNDHRLNATQALLEADRRPHVVHLLAELARGTSLAHYVGGLAEFLERHPGVGRLFEPVARAVNEGVEGVSRLAAFEAHARRLDAARGIGATPRLHEQIVLEDYALRLRRRVQPAVEREVRGLAAAIAEETGSPAFVSARTKRADGIVDKVERMVRGRPGKPGRPNFRAGDVADAVGVRLTVRSMAALETALDVVMQHFGTGDGGRILEVENMYAKPKAAQPAYRVIPMIVAVDVDGLPYSFELQLTTERASLAADVEHNTLYKPYVPVGEDEERVVMAAMREAAALDQLETAERNNNG